MAAFGEEWEKRFRRQWWEPEPLIINRPRPHLLEISKSRTRSGFALLAYMAFFVFWYGVLIGMANARLPGHPLDGFKELVTEHWWLVLHPFAPLLALGRVVAHVKVLVAGYVLLFNSDTRRIERNGHRLAHFDEVSRVQIWTVSHSQEGVEYRLSLVFNDEKKLRLGEQSVDHEEIYAAAEEIADILDLSVTYT